MNTSGTGGGGGVGIGVGVGMGVGVGLPTTFGFSRTRSLLPLDALYSTTYRLPVFTSSVRFSGFLNPVVPGSSVCALRMPSLLLDGSSTWMSPSNKLGILKAQTEL